MNCIIIEDQTPAQRLLKGYIESVSELELKGTFSNAIDAMVFLKTCKIDVIFLDIHLPKLSGIEFLQTVNTNSKVILTTAFSEYALESYDFEVVDYLLKPFSFQRFLKSIEKLVKTGPVIQANEKVNKIFIKSGYEYVKINLDEILYIKSDGDYTEIVLECKKYLSSQSLKQWKDFLESSMFTQIHKSYIINVNVIEKILGNQVFIEHQHVLPIGRAYKETFVSTFISSKGFMN